MGGTKILLILKEKKSTTFMLSLVARNVRSCRDNKRRIEVSKSNVKLINKGLKITQQYCHNII